MIPCRRWCTRGCPAGVSNRKSKRPFSAAPSKGTPFPERSTMTKGLLKPARRACGMPIPWPR